MVKDYKSPRRSNNNPIANARIAKGLTQEQLACIIGVDKRQISAWERGRFYPSLLILQKIAGALDVDWVELAEAQLEKKKYSGIANARHEKGWTQRELAEKIGVSQGLISNYENGASTPTEAALKRLSAVLGVPVEAIAPLEGDKGAN